MEKYWKVSAIALVNTMEYRLDFFFDLVSKFFPAVIQFFMWTAIFQNSPREIIMNYTYKQMILYTVLSIFVSTLISVNIHWGIAQDIKNGTLSKYIILPINYFFYKVFQFVGSKLWDILMIGLGMSLLLFWFRSRGMIHIDFPGLGLFLITAVMALMLQFLIYYCISGVAFWIGDCGGIFTVANVISLILSGAVFPLDIFGEAAVRISQLFPFYYITYFPTNVIIGKVSVTEAGKAFCIMGIWLVLLVCLTSMLWKKGMKKYIAAGG